MRLVTPAPCQDAGPLIRWRTGKAVFMACLIGRAARKVKGGAKVTEHQRDWRNSTTARRRQSFFSRITTSTREIAAPAGAAGSSAIFNWLAGASVRVPLSSQ